MGYGKGTQSSSDISSVELALLGSIKESQYAKTLVRLVKLSWRTRAGETVNEQEPRIDVREYKTGERFQGWGKGLSMKVEDYRRFKAMIPAIDQALKDQGVTV